MTNAQKKLEQSIGMENLFTLGGFIEETARKIVKESWENALPYIAMQMGAGHMCAASLGDLYQTISEIIAAYKDDSEKKDLYLTIMDEAKAYFSNHKEVDMESDQIDDEMFPRMNFSEN